MRRPWPALGRRATDKKIGWADLVWINGIQMNEWTVHSKKAWFMSSVAVWMKSAFFWDSANSRMINFRFMVPYIVVITWIRRQLDVLCFKILKILFTLFRSTCFGHHCVHHQELLSCTCSLWSLTIIRIPVVYKYVIMSACGRSPAEIVGSNPTGGMDICPLWVSCVVR